MARDVFVISDLHLGGAYEGGPRGFRLCTKVPILTQFVEWICARAKEKERDLELVINGDLVDFLAEPQEGVEGDDKWTAFVDDQDEALRRFNEIVERDANFFGALKDLVEAKYALTLILGNHDLELSFPKVRERLAEVLCVDRDSRFVFNYDSEPYVIGSKPETRALIEHGNRYDGWNRTYWGALAHLRAFHARGIAIPRDHRYRPCPGSSLVAELMNPIKGRFPFVDLLKPEEDAVVPILATIVPGMKERLKTLRALSKRADSAEKGAAKGAVPNKVELAKIASKKKRGGGGAALTPMVARRNKPAPVESDDPIDKFLESAGAEVKPIASTKQLLSLAAGWGDLRSKADTLAKALQILQKDESFEVRKDDPEPYLSAAQQIATEGRHKYVLFGHTHLAKHMALDGGGEYLNTGTWADLMQVPEKTHTGSQAERKAGVIEFVDDLQKGRVEKWGITFRPTFAQLVVEDDGEVSGAKLRLFDGKSNTTL